VTSGGRPLPRNLLTIDLTTSAAVKAARRAINSASSPGGPGKSMQILERNLSYDAASLRNNNFGQTWICLSKLPLKARACRSIASRNNRGAAGGSSIHDDAGIFIPIVSIIARCTRGACRMSKVAIRARDPDRSVERTCPFNALSTAWRKSSFERSPPPHPAAWPALHNRGRGASLPGIPNEASCRFTPTQDNPQRESENLSRGGLKARTRSGEASLARVITMTA